jgi:hypothetical protein
VEIDSRRRHSPEIVSLFDRPTEDGFFVSLIVFHPSICCRWRVFEGFVIFQISTGSCFGHQGRGKPEVTSPFDSSTPLSYSGLLTSFAYLFPFKSYSTFSLRLEIPIGLKFWGFGDF